MKVLYRIIIVQIILSVSFILPACSSQLGGAKGKVIDAQSDQPIAGAEVIATTTSNIESEQRYLKLVTKTTKDGFFQIKGLRGKDYKIRIYKEGYSDIEQFLEGIKMISVTIPEESNYIFENPIELYPFPSEWLEVSDLTIKDKNTGLLWAENSNNLAYREAQGYIEKLNNENYAGYSNWRLPNSEELLSLCNKASNYGNSIRIAKHYSLDPNSILNKIGFNNLGFDFITDQPNVIVRFNYHSAMPCKGGIEGSLNNRQTVCAVSNGRQPK